MLLKEPQDLAVNLHPGGKKYHYLIRWHHISTVSNTPCARKRPICSRRRFATETAPITANFLRNQIYLWLQATRRYRRKLVGPQKARGRGCAEGLQRFADGHVVVDEKVKIVGGNVKRHNIWCIKGFINYTTCIYTTAPVALRRDFPTKFATYWNIPIHKYLIKDAWPCGSTCIEHENGWMCHILKRRSKPDQQVLCTSDLGASL